MMPIDKMNDLICEMENDPDRPESMDGLLQMLRDKRESLPEDISEKEIDRIVMECVVRSASAQARTQMTMDEDADEEDDGSLLGDLADLFSEEEEDEEDRMRLSDRLEELEASRLEDTERIADALEEHLQDVKLRYTPLERRRGSRAFQLGMSLEKGKCFITIIVHGRHIIFTVDPMVSVDPLYTMPLSHLLCTINDGNPFGSFVLNKRNNDLSLDYSYLVSDEFDSTAFGTILIGLCKECDANLDRIRRTASGRFSRSDKKKLIEQTRALLRDLEEDE